MRKLACLLVASVVLLGVGCKPAIKGSGNLSTHHIEINAPVESVALALSDAILEINRGNRNELVITIDDNLFEHLDLETGNGELEIKSEKFGSISPSETVSVILTLENPDTISKLVLAGTGAITASEMHPGDMEVDLAGIGKILLPSLTTDFLEVNIAGAGDVYISGQTMKQEIKIAGKGSYHAMDLGSTYGDISVAGSGEIYLNVEKKLDISIVGNGKVRVKGDPEIKSSVVGSGDIKRVKTNE